MSEIGGLRDEALEILEVLRDEAEGAAKLLGRRGYERRRVGLGLGGDLVAFCLKGW